MPTYDNHDIESLLANWRDEIAKIQGSAMSRRQYPGQFGWSTETISTYGWGSSEPVRREISEVEIARNIFDRNDNLFYTRGRNNPEKEFSGRAHIEAMKYANNNCDDRPNKDNPEWLFLYRDAHPQFYRWFKNQAETTDKRSEDHKIYDRNSEWVDANLKLGDESQAVKKFISLHNSSTFMALQNRQGDFFGSYVCFLKGKNKGVAAPPAPKETEKTPHHIVRQMTDAMNQVQDRMEGFGWPKGQHLEDNEEPEMEKDMSPREKYYEREAQLRKRVDKARLDVELSEVDAAAAVRNQHFFTAGLGVVTVGSAVMGFAVTGVVWTVILFAIALLFAVGVLGSWGAQDKPTQKALVEAKDDLRKANDSYSQFTLSHHPDTYGLEGF